MRPANLSTFANIFKDKGREFIFIEYFAAYSHFLLKFAGQTNFQMLGVTSIPLSGSASQDAQRGCSFDYSDFHRPFHHCLRWSFFLPDRERGERGCTRKTGGTGTANAGKLSRSRLERWNQMEAKSLSLL